MSLNDAKPVYIYSDISSNNSELSNCTPIALPEAKKSQSKISKIFQNKGTFNNSIPSSVTNSSSSHKIPSCNNRSIHYSINTEGITANNSPSKFYTDMSNTQDYVDHTDYNSLALKMQDSNSVVKEVSVNNTIDDSISSVNFPSSYSQAHTGIAHIEMNNLGSDVSNETGRVNINDTRKQTTQINPTPKWNLLVNGCPCDRYELNGWQNQPKRKNGVQLPLHACQLLALFLVLLIVSLWIACFQVPYAPSLYKNKFINSSQLKALHSILLPLHITFYITTAIVIALKAAITIIPNSNVESGSDLWCAYCNEYVPSNSRHCKACNTCIPGFDHHCKWLNTCIGAYNYKLFIAFIVALACNGLYATTVSIYMIIKLWHISPLYAICTSIFLSILLTTLTCSIIKLLVFHIKLRYRGFTSTYSYIVHKRSNTSLSQGA